MRPWLVANLGVRHLVLLDATIKDSRFLAKLLHFVKVVGCKKNSSTVFIKLFNCINERSLALDVKPGTRLIENQNLGFVQEGPRD